jgi:hypothetical protein
VPLVACEPRLVGARECTARFRHGVTRGTTRSPRFFELGEERVRAFARRRLGRERGKRDEGEAQGDEAKPRRHRGTKPLSVEAVKPTFRGAAIGSKDEP